MFSVMFEMFEICFLIILNTREHIRQRKYILFKWPVFTVFCSESFGGILGEIRDSTNSQAERETSRLRKRVIPELLT